MTPFAQLEKSATAVNPSMRTAVLRSLQRLLTPVTTQHKKYPLLDGILNLPKDQLQGMNFSMQPSSKNPKDAIAKLMQAGAQVEKAPVEIPKWLQTQRQLGGVLGSSAEHTIARLGK